MLSHQLSKKMGRGKMLREPRIHCQDTWSQQHRVNKSLWQVLLQINNKKRKRRALIKSNKRMMLRWLTHHQQRENLSKCPIIHGMTLNNLRKYLTIRMKDRKLKVLNKLVRLLLLELLQIFKGKLQSIFFFNLKSLMIKNK